MRVVITWLKIPKTGLTLVRNELLTTKLFTPFMHICFFYLEKKIERKFTETQGNSSKVQTQLLSNLNAAKSWVTWVLPFNLLPEYMRKTYIKGFLSFLAGWHPSHSSSNLQQFALNHILWVSAAGEDQSTPQVGSGSCTGTNLRGERSSQHSQVRVSYVLCTDFL